MPDNDKQIIFDKAAKAYSHAQKTIEAMDEVFRNISGANYNPEATCAQFDLILQGVLLAVACSDGRFDETERLFVESIAMHGDLLEYIARDSDGEIDLSWDMISEFPDEARQTLVSILPSALEKQCRSFILPLITVDLNYSEFGRNKTTPGAFLESIESDMVTISSLLAFVDDESRSDELTTAAEMIYKLVDRHWKEIIRNESQQKL